MVVVVVMMDVAARDIRRKKWLRSPALSEYEPSVCAMSASLLIVPLAADEAPE